MTRDPGQHKQNSCVNEWRWNVALWQKFIEREEDFRFRRLTDDVTAKGIEKDNGRAV